MAATLELLIASLAVIAAATIFAARMPPRGTVAFLLAVALLSQAMVVVTIGVAGLLIRTFAPAVLVAMAFGWLGLAAVLVWRAPAAAGAWRVRAGGAVTGVRTMIREPAVALATVLVLGSLVWRTILALRLPVVDYDGWSYHLVFVDVWLQHDSLALVPQRPWTAGYPATTEMLTTWLAAFSRSDAMAGFTSLVPIPAAIVGTVGLARAFGARPYLAILAGLLLGMTPALIALAGTTYVDAASVSAVIATWWLGLRLIRGERDASAALLLGIAAGLALGAKGTNALLVAPIGLVVGLVLLRDLADRAGTRASRAAVARSLVMLAVPVLVLGASWYLKNLVVYGNPLYPFRIGPFAGPTTLSDFALVVPRLEGKNRLLQLAISWTADWDLTRYAFNVRPGGLGRAWPLVVILAIGGAFVLVRRRRFDALALVILPAAITILVMPMPWYARLTLFAPAIGLGLAAVAIGMLPRRAATATSIVIVAIAAVSLVFANARPNIDIRDPSVANARSAGPLGYLAYVFDPSDARRSNVSLRAECAGFDQIPPGARVAPGGFNLLHGVIGHDLSRVLTDPLGEISGPAALVQAMRDQRAEWLVTGSGNPIDRIVSADPDRWEPRGDICQGARLWKLRSG